MDDRDDEDEQLRDEIWWALIMCGVFALIVAVGLLAR